MLKSRKLRKLKKEANMYYTAAYFCLQKQHWLIDNKKIRTLKGKDKFWEYDRRFEILLKAYYEKLHEINKLAYGY